MWQILSEIDKVIKRKLKGEEGEKLVAEAIEKLFSEIHPNFEPVLIPQVHLPNPNGSTPLTADFLLVHPFFGIRILEVKNVKDFSNINRAISQVKSYTNITKDLLKERLDEKSIKNFVKPLLIYPSLSRKSFLQHSKKQPILRHFEDFIVLKEDLKNGTFLEKVALSSDTGIKTLEESIPILENCLRELLAGEELAKSLKKLKRKPLITPSGIHFVDLIQLSNIKTYKQGLRIIRGIAGTGKTFLAEELLRKWKGRALFLMFNSELFKKEQEKFKGCTNVEVQKLISFVNKLLKRRNSSENLEKFFSHLSKETSFLKKKLEEYKSNNKISLLVIDEAQDFPPYLLNLLSKVFENCVIFIDESQAINTFSTHKLKDAFKDVDLRGRKVRNLKTVYRTPIKIFNFAKEILNNDKSINKYFREVGDNLENFESILDGGIIKLIEGNLDIKNLHKEFAINSPNAIFVKGTRERDKMREIGLNAYTFESVKGLEFRKVLLFDLGSYIDTIVADPNSRRLLWRKLFVAITRAEEEVIVNFRKFNSQEAKTFREILLKYIRREEENKQPKIRTIDSYKNLILNLTKEIILELTFKSLGLG